MDLNRGYRKSIIPDTAKRVFEGVIFDIYQWDQELYDGTTEVFEKAVRPDTAVIFPILPDGNILLVEDTQPDRGMIVTAPAGKVEDGETPQETACRELLEETGYSVDDAELLYSFQPERKLDYKVYVFVGHGAKQVKEPMPEPGEKIVLKPISFDELVELVERGEYEGDEFSMRIFREKLKDPTLSTIRSKFHI